MKKLFTIDLDGSGQRLYVENGVLYAATALDSPSSEGKLWNYGKGTGNGLEIYDVTYPQKPYQLWELSQKVDKGSTNTLIDQIFSSINDLIDGRLVCGAGGGGFLQVILKKGVTKKDVHNRLKAVFQDSLVDVWDCELVW